jgi:ABC-type amino acid transport substrate-binding protein
LLAVVLACSGAIATQAQAAVAKSNAATGAAAAASAQEPVPPSGSPLVRVPDGRMLAPDMARIVLRGELIVAILNKDTPPFVQEKGGVLSGVDIDLVRQIGKELMVPVRFDRSAKTYDEVVQLVANGQADLGVSKLARTLKRAQSVLFSTPYMRLEHALLINRLAFAHVARDQSVTQAVRNFTGTIGVLAGSAWEEFARRNFVKATVVPFPLWRDAVEAVKRGEVATAYRDAIEVRSIMQADPSLALTLRTVSFSDLQSILCVMVGSRDVVLLSFVNEVVANQTEQLSVSKLLKLMK